MYQLSTVSQAQRIRDTAMYKADKVAASHDTDILMEQMIVLLYIQVKMLGRQLKIGMWYP